MTDRTKYQWWEAWSVLRGRNPPTYNEVQLQTALEEARSQLVNKDAEIERLRVEVERLREALSSRALAEVHAELREAELRLVDKDAEIENLRGVLSRQEVDFKQFKVKAGYYKGDVKWYQCELKRLEEEVQSLQKVLGDKEREIKELRERYKGARVHRDEVHTLETKLKDKSDVIFHLETLLQKEKEDSLDKCLKLEEMTKLRDQWIDAKDKMSCEVDRLKMESEMKDVDLVRIRGERNKALGAVKMWKDSKEKLAVLLKEARQGEQQQIKLMFGKQDKQFQSQDVTVDMDCGEDLGLLFGTIKCFCSFSSFEEQRFNRMNINYFGQLKFPNPPKFLFRSK